MPNLLSIFAILLIFSIPSIILTQASIIVNIEQGQLQGAPSEYDANTTVYKGIPFAASTAGSNRWKPPQPAPKWEVIKNATEFGPICPQLPYMNMALPTVNEDCLMLNIWVPSGAKNAPVYVWIYGGRFEGGYGSDREWDGVGLARKGLVMITFNYRVGVMGFLAHPELSQESGKNASGNYGLMDQIAALKWVKANIAAFGGDPNKVTIGGESAGAGSVFHLLLSPLAKGLFHRAIAESGPLFPRDPEIAALPPSYRTKDLAETRGIEFMQNLNASTIDELRSFNLSILQTTNNANDLNVSAPTASNGNPPLWRPVLDGYVMARTYLDSLAQGKHSDVPFMVGINHDEFGPSPNPNMTLAQFREWSKSKFGEMANQFMQLYPVSTDAEANATYNEAAREGLRISVYLLAKTWAMKAESPVYTYFWTHTPPGAESQGAHHGSEIPYFLNTLYAYIESQSANYTEKDYQIAETMSNYIVNFATSANPNFGRFTNLPAWIPIFVHRKLNYDLPPSTMEVGDNFGMMPVADGPEKVKFWSEFFNTQKVW